MCSIWSWGDNLQAGKAPGASDGAARPLGANRAALRQAEFSRIEMCTECRRLVNLILEREHQNLPAAVDGVALPSSPGVLACELVKLAGCLAKRAGVSPKRAGQQALISLPRAQNLL